MIEYITSLMCVGIGYGFHYLNPKKKQDPKFKCCKHGHAWIDAADPANQMCDRCNEVRFKPVVIPKPDTQKCPWPDCEGYLPLTGNRVTLEGNVEFFTIKLTTVLAENQSRGKSQECPTCGDLIVFSEVHGWVRAAALYKKK